MTRETKIGLVVSCCFLCLVGLVIGKKLHEMGHKTAVDDAPASSTPSSELAKAETPKTADPHAGKVTRASAEEVSLDPLPGMPQDEFEKELKTNPAKPHEPKGEATKTEKGSGDKDPDLPDPEEISNGKPRVAVATDDSKKNATPEKNADSGDVKDPDDLPASDGKENPASAGKNKDDGVDKTDGQKEAPFKIREIQEKSPKDTKAPSRGQKTSTELDGAPDDLPPEIPGKPGKTDLDGEPTRNPAKTSEPADKKDTPRIKRDISVSIGQPKTNQTEEDAKDDLKAVRPAGPDKNNRPTVEVTIPSRPMADPVATPERDPQREPIKVVTAPTRHFPVSTVPEVDSYDEEIYRSRSGETFDRISQRYYQTDRFGRALEAYNRAHPQVGEQLRQQAGKLVLGQRVFVPPVEILRKRHGKLIVEDQPADRDERSTSSRTSPARDSGRSRDYTVRNPDGETMKDIAQMLLGDANRWQEIARLNPGFQPSLPIPETATIKLPE